MTKFNVAGLIVDILKKNEFLAELQSRLEQDKKTFVITPYSEFLYECLINPESRAVFNKADYSLPDGIGIFWCYKFLSLPLKAKSFYGKVAQSIFQVLYTLSSILVAPKWLRGHFPEKIVGANLIWDLSEMASKYGYSVYFLGGFGSTPQITAKKLKSKYPDLRIAGFSSKNPDDPTIVSDIATARADLLFVAFGPIRQEKWIAMNWENLPVRLAIGLGGTFDYIAGEKKQPPEFIRMAGLEWLYRLITQPYRWQRIVNATYGLIKESLRYKVFTACPYRKNVVSIIINENNRLLVFRRNPQDHGLRDIGEINVHKFNAYWQFSQGGVDNGEDIITAARREVREETGLTNLVYVRTSKSVNRYAYKTSRRLFGNKYKARGKEQQIIYFRFDGQDSEIKLDNQELVDFQWINLKDLKKVLHPERWPVADIVTADLAKP